MPEMKVSPMRFSNLKSGSFILALLLSLAAFQQAAMAQLPAPRLDWVYPPGGQVGTSLEVTAGGGRASQLATNQDVDHVEKIRQLYLVAFSRYPDQEELNIALQHIDRFKEDPKRAYEDICWALLNTKEFMFNH